MNEYEHLDNLARQRINKALELYAENLQQVFAFLELAMEVKNDLRSRDYFKISYTYLQKATIIIADLSNDYPSQANLWTRMRDVVKAYDDQVSHAFQWNQYIRDPNVDINNPKCRSMNRKYIFKNRKLASQSNKLELQAVKLLRNILE